MYLPVLQLLQLVCPIISLYLPATHAAQAAVPLAYVPLGQVGFYYDHGTGIEQSVTEAFQYFKLAADQGQCAAQKSVGGMYAQGRGVIKSDELSSTTTSTCTHDATNATNATTNQVAIKIIPKIKDVEQWEYISYEKQMRQEAKIMQRVCHIGDVKETTSKYIMIEDTPSVLFAL